MNITGAQELPSREGVRIILNPPDELKQPKIICSQETRQQVGE